jgi:hypothetical protein
MFFQEKILSTIYFYPTKLDSSKLLKYPLEGHFGNLITPFDKQKLRWLLFQMNCTVFACFYTETIILTFIYHIFQLHLHLLSPFYAFAKF